MDHEGPRLHFLLHHPPVQPTVYRLLTLYFTAVTYVVDIYLPTYHHWGESKLAGVAFVVCNERLIHFYIASSFNLVLHLADA